MNIILRGLIPFLLLTTGWATAQQFIDLEFQERIPQDVLQTSYPFIAVEGSIEAFKVTYTTPDVFGVLDTASGLLVLPSRAVDTPSFPVVVYQHGTSVRPELIPSDPTAPERELIFGLAAAGFITLAPDYLGLGESRGFHPYVHAESEASAAIDLIRAFQAYATTQAFSWDNQLYITGYSQGGHASMALHRAIESDPNAEFSVTAASHMSGPYSISEVMLDLALSEVPYFFPAYLFNTFLSYNYVYELYESIEAVVAPPYVAMVDSFSRGEITLEELNNRAVIKLTAENGVPRTRDLFQDSLRENIRTPGHPMLVALQENDVFNWTPQAPTRILYCTADDQVPFRNAIITDSIMQRNGTSDLLTVDVNPNANHNDCVFPAALVTLTVFNQIQATITSTENPPKELAVRIYPNPAQEILVVEGVQAGGQLQLFDAQGQLQLRKQVLASPTQLSLEQVPKGTYFLQFVSEKGQSVVRSLQIQ